MIREWRDVKLGEGHQEFHQDPRSDHSHEPFGIMHAFSPALPNGVLGDAGVPVSKPRIEAALAAIGAAPLKCVIDTHYHCDHTDGSVWMHKAGAAVVAH